MVKPTFESTEYVCKSCGGRFRGSECEKKPSDFISSLFNPPIHPKCPKCGSNKTEKDPLVSY